MSEYKKWNVVKSSSEFEWLDIKHPIGTSFIIARDPLKGEGVLAVLPHVVWMAVFRYMGDSELADNLCYEMSEYKPISYFED